MHILLRTELEKLALTGEIKVSDLPEFWNDYMEKLLGIRPRTYGEGVLQDIHWSMGSIGYFPTYTLGNMVAASMRYAMEKEIKLRERVASGEFETIQNWQKDRIHKYGATYPPKELLRKAIGVDYEPEHLIRYLAEKYLK